MPIFSRPVERAQVTVDYIAELILKEWSQEDLEFVKSGDHDFGMVGRAIRNDYGLWEFDHPLTQHWHMYPDARNIVDGVDCSEDHPDQVSADILDLVRAKLGVKTEEVEYKYGNQILKLKRVVK